MKKVLKSSLVPVLIVINVFCLVSCRASASYCGVNDPHRFTVR